MTSENLKLNPNLAKFIEKVSKNPEMINPLFEKKTVEEQYQYAQTIQNGFTLDEFKSLLSVILMISKKMSEKNLDKVSAAGTPTNAAPNPIMTLELTDKDYENTPNNTSKKQNAIIGEQDKSKKDINSLHDDDLKKVSGGADNFWDTIYDFGRTKNMGEQMGKPLGDAFRSLYRTIKATPEQLKAEDEAAQEEQQRQYVNQMAQKIRQEQEYQNNLRFLRSVGLA